MDGETKHKNHRLGSETLHRNHRRQNLPLLLRHPPRLHQRSNLFRATQRKENTVVIDVRLFEKLSPASKTQKRYQSDGVGHQGLQA